MLKKVNKNKTFFKEEKYYYTFFVENIKNIKTLLNNHSFFHFSFKYINFKKKYCFGIDEKHFS